MPFLSRGGKKTFVYLRIPVDSRIDEDARSLTNRKRFYSLFLNNFVPSIWVTYSKPASINLDASARVCTTLQAKSSDIQSLAKHLSSKDVANANLQPASITKLKRKARIGLCNNRSSYSSNNSALGAPSPRVKNTVQYDSCLSEPKSEPVRW